MIRFVYKQCCKHYQLRRAIICCVFACLLFSQCDNDSIPDLTRSTWKFQLSGANLQQIGHFTIADQSDGQLTGTGWYFVDNSANLETKFILTGHIDSNDNVDMHWQMVLQGPFSDIDIIVVSKRKDLSIIKEIRNVGYDLEIKNGIILSIQVFSEDYVNYLRDISTLFIENVDKEAIVI